MNTIELLVRSAFEIFTRGSRSPTKMSISCTDQHKLRDLLGKCCATDVHLHKSMEACLLDDSDEEKRPPITYIDVFEHPLFTVGIFILHPNAKIPLHDHPGMFGFIKVLCGEMKLTSYTRIKVPGQQLIAYEEQSVLNSSSPVADLTPTERNYHQLEYIKGENEHQDYTAFLDILSPPYNSLKEKPECNYYNPNKLKTRVAQQDSKSNSDETASVPVVELRKCPCPSGFYNDVAPYMGPSLRRLLSELR